MQNFYIKSGEHYCILGEKRQELGLIAIIQYLVDTSHITHEKIIEALKEVSGFIKTEAQRPPFLFSFINFNKNLVKNAAQKTDVYSITNVAQNFNDLNILQKNMKLFELEYKKHTEIISKITTEQFKNYFSYENYLYAHMNNYSWGKMRQAHSKNSFGWSDERRQNYQNEEQKFKEEARQKFPFLKIIHVLPMDEFIKNHYKTTLAAWKKVLDDSGHPLVVEENGFIQRFNEKEGYALFLKDQYRNEGNFGFWGSTNSTLTDINQAKLFQNFKQASRYASSMHSEGIAIVKVNVKFEEVVHTIGKIDVSALDAAKSAQEKAYFDSLMNNENEVKSLATKLLHACGEKHQELKEHLNRLIEEKEEVIIVKKRQKI